VAFSPPLIITRGEIDEMCDRFATTLDEILAMMQRSGALTRRD
jgi:adenosylmethionine-8-amino-7-oxononanoate aminotransferase